MKQFLAFIVKLNWLNGVCDELGDTCVDSEDGEDRNVDSPMESKVSSTSGDNRGIGLIFFCLFQIVCAIG